MVSARSRTPGWSGIVLVALLPFVSQAGAAESVETVEKAAAQWAQLREETVRLQSDWQWQRGTLESSLDGLKTRLAKLEQERDGVAAAISNEDATSANLVKRNDETRQAMKTVESRITRLTQQILAVRPFLPPRLARALDLPFRSIQDEKLGPAERMQHLVTIFNRCGLFNKSITLGEEELNLDGGANPRLLEVIYWGLAFGYALDRADQKAYFGHPGKEGWTWEPRPDAAPAVTRLIAIQQEKSDPAFVSIPVQISEPFTAPR